MIKVGKKYRCGGKYGPIMTVQSVSGSDAVLVSNACTFYYHKGDCVLIPVKDFEQLSLFDYEL